MVICHCLGISDAAIGAAVEEGARDAAGIGNGCGAGTGCGGCWPALEALVAAYGLAGAGPSEARASTAA